MTFIQHFLARVLEVFSNGIAWVMGLFVFMVDCLGGHKVAVNLVIIAVVTDLVWGIISSIRQHRFAKSELARDTLGKVSVYGCAILTFAGIDRIYNTGLTTNLICTVIVLVELWSTLGSMLICFPGMPFLKILKFALVGEIASKLGVSEDKVKEIMEAEERLRKHRKEKANGGNNEET